jgi:hypothetical protein
VHFRNFAPEKVPYANERYQYEAKRHYGVLDRHPGQERGALGGRGQEAAGLLGEVEQNRVRIEHHLASRRKRCPTPTNATSTRRSATTASSTGTSPSTSGWWAVELGLEGEAVLEGDGLGGGGAGRDRVDVALHVGVRRRGSGRTKTDIRRDRQQKPGGHAMKSFDNPFKRATGSAVPPSAARRWSTTWIRSLGECSMSISIQAKSPACG